MSGVKRLVTRMMTVSDEEAQGCHDCGVGRLVFVLQATSVVGDLTNPMCRGAIGAIRPSLKIVADEHEQRARNRARPSSPLLR